LSVPAIGFTCSDHFHPGWNVARPTDVDFSCTRSSFPFPSLNSRDSVGESNDATSTSAMSPTLCSLCRMCGDATLAASTGDCLEAFALCVVQLRAEHLVRDEVDAVRVRDARQLHANLA